MALNVFTCGTRIYKDAEQRFTQDGTSVVSFTGPVESGFGDKKVTSWIKFTIWGKRSESLFPYLKDKTQVAVSGELANREYTDKEGNKRYSLEVRVNDLQLFGGKPEGSHQEEPKQRSQQQSKPKPSFDDLGDDIPF